VCSRKTCLGLKRGVRYRGKCEILGPRTFCVATLRGWGREVRTIKHRAGEVPLSSPFSEEGMIKGKPRGGGAAGMSQREGRSVGCGRLEMLDRRHLPRSRHRSAGKKGREVGGGGGGKKVQAIEK